MILLFFILTPLIGISILFLIPGKNQTFVKKIALYSSIFSLLVYGYVVTIFKTGVKSQLFFKHSWLSEFDLFIKFEINGWSVLLMGLTSVLIPLIILSSFKIVLEKARGIYALIFLTQMALYGLFSSGDLFLFYFCFEAALIPVYFLSLIWGIEKASGANLKMFIYSIFGSLLMLLAMIFLYYKGQTADIQSLLATAQILPKNVQVFLFAGFFIAFAIKMPIFPFHTWLPDTCSFSSNTVSMLLVSLLSKMGLFGILKIALPLAPLGAREFEYSIIVLATLTLLYGSIIAVKQNESRRLLAYASIAQTGLICAGLFSGNIFGIQGAVFLMLAHGINMVGLFFVLQIITEKTGRKDLKALGGLSKEAPVLSLYFFIILLGSIGLPLTNGFVGEFLLLKGIFGYNKFLGILTAIGLIFAAVYLLRLFQKTMFEKKSKSIKSIEDVRGPESIVLFVLSFLVLFMGIFPNLILEITEPASKVLIDYMAQY